MQIYEKDTKEVQSVEPSAISTARRGRMAVLEAAELRSWSSCLDLTLLD